MYHSQKYVDTVLSSQRGALIVKLRIYKDSVMPKVGEPMCLENSIEVVQANIFS